MSTRILLTLALGMLLALAAPPAPAAGQHAEDWAEAHADEPAGHGHEGHEGHRHDATASHSFEDVERWTKVFDDPERDSWQLPEQVIEFLGVASGDVVADLGAGTGYFTVRLARAVGDTGRVLAVDIEPSLIDHIRERAEAAKLPQVVTILAEPDDPKLPAAEVDLVLVVDTWHHINDRIDYLGHLSQSLAPGGRVAIVDFREGELPVGPPPGHKLSRDAVHGELTEAGWILDSESEDLPYQYVLVFRPPA
jgi:SAM-dependent methyltransferase